MKKTLYTVLPILLFILMMNSISLNAQIIDLSYGEYSSIRDEDSFNYVCGYSEYVEKTTTTTMDNLSNYVSSYIESGTIEATCKGTINGNNYSFKEIQEFLDGEIIRISEYFMDELYFDVTLEPSSDDGEYIINKELDISTITKQNNALFIKSSITFTTNLVLYDENDLEQVTYDAERYLFEFTRVTTVYQNEKYITKDLHIASNYANPLTLEEIQNEIHVSDSSTEATFTIDQCSYDSTKITKDNIGDEFSLRVIARDKNNNISYQIVYINIVDPIKPAIIQKKDIIVSFDDFLTKDDILSYFQIYDVSGTKDPVLDISEYEENLNTLGSYDCQIRVKDTYDNENTLAFKIEVKDIHCPIIAFTTITASTQECLSENQILNYLSAYDDYDGDISDEIKITKESYETYKNNYNQLGNYHVNAYVSDSNGNKVNVSVLISVIDSDYPMIEIDYYTILTEPGTKITKSEIIELYKALGYEISEDELESDCFDIDKLQGKYDLFIHQDGYSSKDIVTTEIEDLSISYVAPILEGKEKESNPILIPTIITGCSIFIFSLCGIVIYKKRH